MCVTLKTEKSILRRTVNVFYIGGRRTVSIYSYVVASIFTRVGTFQKKRDGDGIDKSQILNTAFAYTDDIS